MSYYMQLNLNIKIILLLADQFLLIFTYLFKKEI